MASIKPSKGASNPSKHSRAHSKTNTPSKSRVSKNRKAPPPVQQKTKPSLGPAEKKPKVYTEKELGIPKLNMITPAGVVARKGKKKGKVFVDDQESMMTILAIINASQEGQIESKMMKSRKMEEIREARKKEIEAREELRKAKFDEVKQNIKKRKKKNSNGDANHDVAEVELRSRKRVSFA